MNSFSMLNHANVQESLTSSVGGSVLKQNKDLPHSQDQPNEGKGGFFLTGVNVANKHQDESISPLLQETSKLKEEAEERENALRQIKVAAVIEAKKAFADDKVKVVLKGLVRCH